MGRKERPLGQGDGLVEKLAAELRDLRRSAGNPSYRLMSSQVHFSRSALAHAASGRSMPSLPVLLGYVAACGGDAAQWTASWETLQSLVSRQGAEAEIASAWPSEPAVDGADPDCAGCSQDAITAHARRVAITGQRVVVGKVELRYSARTGAAWSRFAGFSSLDNTARQRKVDVEVQACRESDGMVLSFRDRYVFDYHWSDLVRTSNGPVFARARVYFDGELVATGESDHLMLL